MFEITQALILLEDKVFVVTFFAMAFLVLALVRRVFAMEREIQRNHEAIKGVKTHFANEWTKCIMEDVDQRIGDIKRVTPETKRGTNGRFCK
jgi:hypothetical protein